MAVSAAQCTVAAGCTIPVHHTSQHPMSSAIPDTAAGGETLQSQMISKLSSYLSKFLSDLHSQTSVSPNLTVSSVLPSSHTDGNLVKEPAAVVWSADNTSQSTDLHTPEAIIYTGKSATHSSSAGVLPGVHLKESMPCVF